MYDEGAIGRIQQAAQASVLVVEGANHSLEIPGDILRSLQVMQDVMAALKDFLGRCGV
jgi:hypothetical protein